MKSIENLNAVPAQREKQGKDIFSPTFFNYAEKPYNQDFFDEISESFDVHVRQSIPLFDLFVNNVISNITRYESILDICGSTGKIGDLLNESDYKGFYTCLDGSEEMEKVFLNRNLPENFKFELAGFLQGWENIPTFQTSEKFSLSLEILGYQFFTKTRGKEIREQKKLSDTCIFFEKFSGLDKFDELEELKNTLWKSKFFTGKEIKEKKEKVLDQMGDYLYNQDSFMGLLYDNFDHVVRIAQIGNFAGYICSNKEVTYKVNPELIYNAFNL